MALPKDLEQQLKHAHGVDELPPIVCFFDRAIPDAQATEKSGRPRFKPAIYIEMRTRGSPVKEVFHRQMDEVDKQYHAKEWADYLAKRELVENRAPPLMAIPGMDLVSYEELKALGLFDCEKLAAYDGELQELKKFRRLAQKIMEVSNECFRAQRETVPHGVERPLYSAGGVDRPRAGGTPTGKEETFAYTFKVA